MVSLLVRLGINAAALWAAAQVVSGVHLTGSFWDVVVVALIFGLVNTFIKPVVKLLSLPLLFLTLGLLTFVINALMLWLTAGLTDRMSVDGFGAALLGSLVISIVSFVLSSVVSDDRKESS